MSGLHDARARPGNHHEARLHYLAAEIDRLLVFRPGRGRPGGTEDGHFAHPGIRREELEGETQLAQRRLNDAHISAVLHVLQELQRVVDDVGHPLLVVPPALVINQLPNPPRQLRVSRRLVCLCHSGEDNGSVAERNRARSARFPIGASRYCQQAVVG